MQFLISGYANPGNPSIQIWAVDSESPRLLAAAPGANSSYCILGDGLLFAADEQEGSGAVELYAFEGDRLVQKDRLPIPGGELCHLAYAPTQKALLGACYGTGNIFSVQVVPQEKRFGEMMQVYRQGKKEERISGGSRAHCVVLNQAQDQVFSANIALDRIYLYSLKGGLLAEKGFIQLPKGVGPRHLVLKEDMDKIYVITEYSSEIITISAENTGGFSMESISTLHNNSLEKSYGSTLAFSPDSRFLYAGNRGENTIAVFQVEQNGHLIYDSGFSCGGDWPRDFILTADGRYVVVANQKSGDLSFLPRDSETGKISQPSFRIPMAQVSCVLEVMG